MRVPSEASNPALLTAGCLAWVFSALSLIMWSTGILSLLWRSAWKWWAVLQGMMMRSAPAHWRLRPVSTSMGRGLGPSPRMAAVLSGILALLSMMTRRGCWSLWTFVALVILMST